LALFAQPNPNFMPHVSPPIPAGITVLDDFESNEGHFASGPTASGSTFGVSSNSRVDRVTNESYSGLAAQRITIESSHPSTPGLALRDLSGSGSPANNTAMSSTGFVGFFLKVLDTGVLTGDLQASLIIDDGAAHEQAVSVDIIADGNWHLYEWNLQDHSQWQSFAGGNGQIDAGTVTLDSLYFTSHLNVDFNVFVDLVAHNPSGSLDALLPPNSGDFDQDGDIDGADFVAWQTHFPLASGATSAMGDADGDGDVDGGDLAIWQSQFSAAAVVAGANTVPEPTTGWIALLGVLVAGRPLSSSIFRKK
jgi:hypothetical protein